MNTYLKQVTKNPSYGGITAIVGFIIYIFTCGTLMSLAGDNSPVLLILLKITSTIGLMVIIGGFYWSSEKNYSVVYSKHSYHVNKEVGLRWNPPFKHTIFYPKSDQVFESKSMDMNLPSGHILTVKFKFKYCVFDAGFLFYTMKTMAASINESIRLSGEKLANLDRIKQLTSDNSYNHETAIRMFLSQQIAESLSSTGIMFVNRDFIDFKMTVSPT